MVNKFGDDVEREKVLSHLSDIQHISPILGEYAAQGSLNWIETLFTTTKPIKITSAVMVKGPERAIGKIAPFHRAKNNMADAVIIESYFSAVKSDYDDKNKYLFVNHNTEDFSHPLDNKKLAHPDFDSYFSSAKSKYYINLSEALKSIWPNLISNMLVEREEFAQNPRTLSQILDAKNELTSKIWYNRHQIRVEKIKNGSIRIIEDKYFDPKTAQITITKSIWKGAQKSALNVERRFKVEQLVWNDFEWAMLNGKLSALRWVLGEDWDELYTLLDWNIISL